MATRPDRLGRGDYGYANGDPINSSNPSGYYPGESLVNAYTRTSFVGSVFELQEAYDQGQEEFNARLSGVATGLAVEIVAAPACAGAAVETLGLSLVACDVAGGIVADTQYNWHRTVQESLSG